jgi:hypothetical protein
MRFLVATLLTSQVGHRVAPGRPHAIRAPADRSADNYQAE